jgi:signal transduction histidine kinase
MGCMSSTSRLLVSTVAAVFILAAPASAEERLKPGFAADPGALFAEAEQAMNAEPRRALDLTAQILEHPDATFSAESLARLHYIRARASTHTGQHQQAISESELALEVLDGSEPALRADILTTMSISLARSRETRRGFELQQQALALRRELGDVAGEATSLSSLAEIYLDIGLIEKGVASFEEAVVRARESGDTLVLAVTLNNFAYFLRIRGEHQRAMVLLEEALTLDVKSPRLQAYIFLNAADVLYFLGRPEDAELLISKGLPTAEELQQPLLLVAANLARARIARDRGALVEARDFAKAALDHARDIDDQRELSEITKLLADISEELGDHEAAYNYLRGHAAHLAADAASAVESSAALFEAETTLAAREQEMQLLRRDSEITKLAVAREKVLRNAAIVGAFLLAVALAMLALLLREKARAKRGIELKNRELVAAYDQLETANRNKSNFLSVMSHELKTPLNSIIGFSDLLAKANSENPSTAEFARIINNQGRNLLRMVSEILLFTRASDHEIALDESLEATVEILSLAATMACDLRPAGAGRIEIAVDVPELQICCDLHQLASCAARLLDNALKFSPPTSAVSLCARQIASGELEILIGDDGPGLNEELLPSMVDVLTQGDQSLTRSQDGVGLGLPIANRIAAAHGGSLRISQKPAGGAVACIVIPASRIQAERAAA